MYYFIFLKKLQCRNRNIQDRVKRKKNYAIFMIKSDTLKIMHINTKLQMYKFR